MHTYKSSNGFIFHFNSDFSGDVVIRNQKLDSENVLIPGKDLLEFIAYNYILPKKIEKLEDMDYKKLLI